MNENDKLKQIKDECIKFYIEKYIRFLAMKLQL